MTKKEIFDIFTLPILNTNTFNINKELLDDLELINTKDPSQTPIYNKIFKTTTTLGDKCLKKWGQYYTNNIPFLEESQKIYKNFNLNIKNEIIEKAYQDWCEIKNTNNFCERYQYIEWERIKGINRYSSFLTFLSYYNLSSPLFNLALPIFILILPFFILKMGKIPITWDTYSKLIIMQVKNHIIGKIFYNFKNTNWNQQLYYLFSLALYIYNIYQNIISCYKFYSNTHKISNYFKTLQDYLKYTIYQMENFKNITTKYKTYDITNAQILYHKGILTAFYDDINIIHGKIISFKKIAQIGYVMKQFFVLYDDAELEKSFSFSFGFNGYCEILNGINYNIKNNNINKSKFILSKKPIVKFKKSFSPSLINENPVKNNINMFKNIIITGPNAAGKTTLIKSTLLNILLSQQIGYGCFKSGKLTPFKHIHAYINIPDTIARDSLFQAEARRCKEIIDIIQKNPNEKHFCIFDELYSGTNPYEAISSAYSYLKYMNQFKNVKYMLTTHYIKLCKLFNEDKDTRNFNMQAIIEDKQPIYSYKMTRGISSIKGGICVLRELKYPKIIIQNTEKILKKL